MICCFRVLVCAGLLLSINSYADLPYTFSAGAPAKASQVNANFSALDGRISAVEGGGGNSCGLNYGFGRVEPFHGYSYSYVDLPVGSAVTVGGKQYEITRIPFLEFKTGDHYAVKMPVEVVSCSGVSPPACIGTYMNYVYLSASHVKTACGYSETFSGFPAFISYSDGISYNMNGQNRLQSNFDFYPSASLGVFVLINETMIYLGFSVNSGAQGASATASSDRDLADNVDWLSLADPIQQVQQAAQLMNYVKIEKLP